MQTLWYAFSVLKNYSIVFAKPKKNVAFVIRRGGKIIVFRKMFDDSGVIICIYDLTCNISKNSHTTTSYSNCSKLEEYECGIFENILLDFLLLKRIISSCRQVGYSQPDILVPHFHQLSSVIPNLGLNNSNSI